MTAPKKVFVLFRVLNFDTHGCVPLVGDRGKTLIERRPQIGNEVWQWIGKVFVLATPKTMSPHDNMAAKQLILRVECGNLLAFIWSDEPFEHRAALIVEIERDLFPI